MIVAAYISYAQTWAFLPLVAKILGEFDARRGRAYTVMEHSVRNFRMSNECSKRKCNHRQEFFLGSQGL
jgi:hypothetical protein